MKKAPSALSLALVAVLTVRAAPPPAAASDASAPPPPPPAAAKAKHPPAPPPPAKAKKSAQPDGKSPNANPEPIVVLPKFEITSSRLTKIDVRIKKLNHEIAREKKKTKSSELDQALNGPKVSHFFALFGGKSTKQREAKAAERVSLMEAERDLLESMKMARSRKEYESLQRQVDDLKEVRRNLDEVLH